MKHFVNYQVLIDTPTTVEAEVAAEQLEIHIEEFLDPEDHVERSNAVGLSTDLPPNEVIARAVAARNALIATKIVQCYDVARELDRVIRLMRANFFDADYAPDDEDSLTFMEICTAVWAGANPAK